MKSPPRMDKIQPGRSWTTWVPSSVPSLPQRAEAGRRPLWRMPQYSRSLNPTGETKLEEPGPGVMSRTRLADSRHRVSRASKVSLHARRKADGEDMRFLLPHERDQPGRSPAAKR